MGESLAVDFSEPVEAVHAWSSGLRHGVLPLPSGTPARPGHRVEVLLTLRFARRRFSLEGEVVSLGGGSRGVVLDFLPQDLHGLVQDLAGDEEPLSSEHGFTSESLEVFEISTGSAEDEFSQGSMSYGEDEPSETRRIHENRHDTVPRSFDPGRARRVWSLRDDRAVEGFTLPDGTGRVLPAPPRFSGTMGRKGWSPVLLHILRDHLTGVLVVDGGRSLCWVYCRRGFPVHVVRSPSRPEDGFEHHAIRHDLLEPEVASHCRYLSRVTGRTFMSVVMRLDLMDEHAVKRLREEVVTHSLRDALNAIRGDYYFFGEPELEFLFHDTPAPVVRTLVSWSIEQQGGISEESAREMVARHGNDHVFLTPLGMEVLPHMGLSEFRSGVLHRLAVADETLQRVARDCPGREKEFIQMLFGLLTLGLVDSGEPARGPRRTRLTAERQLRSFDGRVGLDFFSLVGCHWTDVPSALDDGLQQADEILEKAPPEPGEPDDLDKIRREVTAAVEAAEGTLRDPVERRKYRAQLVNERELQQGASMLRRQGAVAMQMGRHEEARARFEIALEVDPGGADGARRTQRLREALEKLES